MQQPSYDDRFVPAPSWEPAAVRVQSTTAPLQSRRPGHPIPRRPSPSITSPLNLSQLHDQARPFSTEHEAAADNRASESATTSSQATSARISHAISDRVPTENAPSSPASSRPVNSDVSSNQSVSRDPQPSLRQSAAGSVSGQTLTSPPRSSSRSSRPQKALIAALQLAQEAVQLDSSGGNPFAAVKAYARSVALLSDVMEKAVNGDHSQSLASREEEVRKLRSIHDTYAERMEVLCNIYNVSVADVRAEAVALNQAAAASPSVETRSRSTTPAPLSLPTQFTSVPTQPAAEPRTEGAENIGASMVALSLTIEESQEVEAVRTAAPSRALNLPPIRPPPAGLPPPKPFTPSTARPTVPAAAQSTLEAPERSLGHRRVASSGSDRVNYVKSPDSPQHSEGTPVSEILDCVIPPTPTASTPHVVTSASTSRPVSPNLPSPLTPRFSELHGRRGGSESISSQGSVLSNDNESTSSSGYPHPVRSRNAASGSIGSWSDAATPELLERGSRQLQQSVISTSTVFSSIAQRRRSIYPGAPSPPPPLPTPTSNTSVIPPRLAEALPPTTAASLGIPGRLRAVSQPGRRPSQTGAPLSLALGTAPPESASLAAKQSAAPRSASDIRTLPRKISIPHSLAQVRTATNTGFGLHSTQAAGTHTQAIVQVAASQPPPPSPPVDPLRRPFHLMSLLLTSMSSKQGGFLTRKLYVPHDVWSQGGAKLNNLPEKGKCVEALNTALEEVVTGSGEFFRGAGRSSAERWLKCLEEFSTVCEGVLSSVGKKLGVGEGIVSARKGSGVTSWSGKFSRTLDRMTNNKSFDSPSLYVNGLTKLFQQAQTFDEHIKAFSNSFLPTPYSALAPDLRHQIETRLRRSSEFFASVVLTWVIRDLGLLLDKYVKKGEKWLEE
ncbi:uncharacterized protein EI90DRAFT_3050620 [Cantharellus anzutake]|uniref:uncharacterized protein n=1 Tax=Cantharellus anzutake TaxID=1750568 RepID=UPI0019081DB9|nr:uncharacterized protein EI90DRAFT_3050620 [Cantharellus anzutake]KAF8334004.1 hypothetical protein EI90DRAFT_3050620 [Cantharellus anzutake]